MNASELLSLRKLLYTHSPWTSILSNAARTPRMKLLSVSNSADENLLSS